MESSNFLALNVGISFECCPSASRSNHWIHRDNRHRSLMDLTKSTCHYTIWGNASAFVNGIDSDIHGLMMILLSNCSSSKTFEATENWSEKIGIKWCVLGPKENQILNCMKRVPLPLPIDWFSRVLLGFDWNAPIDSTIWWRLQLSPTQIGSMHGINMPVNFKIDY